jgi:hypothetical protein
VINGHGCAGRPHPEGGRGIDRTTRMPRRHASGRAKSQSPTPLWSRPSAAPRIWRVSRSTMLGIHGGGLGHGPARADERVDDEVTEAYRGPGTVGNMGGGFEEREPAAAHFVAEPTVPGPEDLHGAGDRDVPDRLEAPFLPPRCDDTARRAARRLAGLDDDRRRPLSRTVSDMTR